MAENANDPNKPATGSESDPFKNFKAEMDRKLQNVNDQIKAQNLETQNMLKAIVANQAKAAPQPPKKASKPLGDMLYDDPEEAVKQIKEEAKREALSDVESIVNTRINTAVQKQNESQSTLNKLVSEYPELSNQSSELFKETVKVYQGLEASLQNRPEGYQLAAREAAANLGVLASSRRQSTDDFTMSGGSDSSTRGQPRERKQKMDPRTAEFARLVNQAAGRNPDDPKIKEGLEKATQRDTWTKYR